MKRIFVGQRGWFTDEVFLEALSPTHALPGSAAVTYFRRNASSLGSY